MKRLSRFFKLKVESIRDSHAVMLDLEVSKSRRFHQTGCPDVSIHVKRSAQGAALASSRCHVPSVHTSWPHSRLLHYADCVSHVSHFRSAALKLFHKILASDSAHPSLTHLANSIVHGAPVSHGSRRPRHDKCTRLVLPYHPALRGVCSRLRALRLDFVNAGFADMAPNVAWSLGGNSILRTCLHDFNSKIDQGGV